MSYGENTNGVSKDNTYLMIGLVVLKRCMGHCSEYWQTRYRIQVTEQIMATYVDRVQLLFLFLSVSEAIVSQLYTVNFEFDSKAPMYTPSDTLPAASLPICASVCGNRCKCFSYNSQTKMCRLHSSCDTTNMTVRNTEWRSYTTPTMQLKGMWFGSLLSRPCINYI